MPILFTYFTSQLYYSTTRPNLKQYTEYHYQFMLTNSLTLCWAYSVTERLKLGDLNVTTFKRKMDQDRECQHDEDS